MSKEATFAVYRGDEFIAVGTKKELAASLGVTPESVYFMSTPVYARRIEGHEDTRLRAYRIEEDDDDDGR